MKKQTSLCKRILIYTVALTLGLGMHVPVFAQQTPVCTPLSKETFYTVKSGDTLGGILFQFNIGPLWGEHRFVDRTARKNSLIKKDALYLNQTIVLPFKCEEELNSYVLEDEGNHRRIVGFKEGYTPPTANAEHFLYKSKRAQSQSPVAQPVTVSTQSISRQIAQAVTELVEKKLEENQNSVATVTTASETQSEVQDLPSPLMLPVSAPSQAPAPEIDKAENHPAPAKVAPEKIPETKSAVVAETDDGDYSIFSVDLFGEYSALQGVDKSNGTSGRLLSKLNPGVRLAWGQQWGPSLRSEIYMKIKSISYLAEKSGTELHDNKMTTTAFGAGMYSMFSERFEWGIGLHEDPTLFYRGSLIGSGLEFNAVPLLRIRPQLAYKAIQRKRLSLSLQVGASYYSPSTYDSYSIDPGVGYDASFILKHQFESGSDFHCSGYYDIRNQNTSLLTMVEKTTGMMCGMSWRMK